MPTIIALDVSLSMTRQIPGQNDENLTYHQLAVLAINQYLDYLAAHSKLEFVSLIVYSTLYEVIVDFTREYDAIRQAIPKLEHYDKTCLDNVLQAISNILLSNWGTQNYCQVLVLTDCGIGFGATSLQALINNVKNKKKISEDENGDNGVNWLPFSNPSKLSFICLGDPSDSYFCGATKMYQHLLEVSGQKGQLFIPKLCEAENGDGPNHKEEAISEITKNGNENETKNGIRKSLNRANVRELIDCVCETNYKQFEALLKCGSYFKLECPIIIWPPPMPYTIKDSLGIETSKMISRKLEVCGFINISDIGSPMSVSRHLVLPKTEPPPDKSIIKGEKVMKNMKANNEYLTTDFEKLEVEIKAFYAKNDTNSDDENATTTSSDSTKESVCVLLHGALKVENMAALVLLNDNWFGFIYSYADSKKKSNLMLTVLKPGHDIIPWLGDLRLLGTVDSALPGENPAFPVKPEKRSYSQNCVVWIKQAGLQSDIQKVLRHAKKLPEKTQHFYKELNRIKRAALSLGFVELLEGLSSIFEREIPSLPANASPDCALQLKHAASELRKLSNRDMKQTIVALPTKYNQ